MRNVGCILFFSAAVCQAQSITTVQQKALNNYVDYANQATDEAAAVVTKVIAYYPTLHKKSTYGAPRYTCPIQLEDYYLNTARNESKALPVAIQASLNAKLQDLRSASEKIDANCKALDTYHKLEDYKQDNFKRANALIADLPALLSDFRLKQDALRSALVDAHKKLAPAGENAYRKAQNLMQAEVVREQRFLDLWSYNLNEEVHTGWPVSSLEQSILETDRQASALKNTSLTLKYPASSMWKNFQESLTSILDVKRNGLDDYNFNAKQSDEHSNGVYLSLINYLNGTLIADYNMFVQYAAGDGHFAMKAMKYFPGMVVGTKPEKITLAIQPFKDIPRVGVVVEKQKTAIPRPAFNSLSNYVEFVNETWRQTRILQMVLGSFSSSAAYFRTLDSFDKRAGLSFDYKNFKLPLSSYQKTLADSKDLSPAIAKSLNDQSTVLLNILGEMDDLCASLAVETQEKKYEQDHLDRVYEILERHKKLFEVWDERKELLYGDVRRVYDAYPPALATDSWYVSGKVLRDLTDLDHDALFLAKGHYQEGKPDVVSTEKIDDALREVIAREYDNMKGIKKFGRNNGLCPYTPYEDLPLTSKSLSEALKQLKPVVNATRNSHPYHKMVYHYNDIVDDYNKFCELSQQVHHLKTIKQPELYSFSPAPPVGKKQAETAASVKTPDVERQPAEYNLPQEQLAVKPVAKTAVLHDTVYIERRDTVYLSEPGEDLHSMEGYAINNMILLLDISGSMNAPEKLPLLKQSVLELLNMMRQEDQISIIAFSGKPKALLTASSFKDESRIKQAIQNLKPSGKTDGNAAVKLAYKVADENYVRAGNNRIILATDGEFAMNDETRELIGHYAREDIFLSVFNFGKGAGSGRALEQVAHLGKGNYSVISPENVEMRLIREAKSKKQK